MYVYREFLRVRKKYENETLNCTPYVTNYLKQILIFQHD